MIVVMVVVFFFLLFLMLLLFLFVCDGRGAFKVDEAFDVNKLVTFSSC